LQFSFFPLKEIFSTEGNEIFDFLSSVFKNFPMVRQVSTGSSYEPYVSTGFGIATIFSLLAGIVFGLKILKSSEFSRRVATDPLWKRLSLLIILLTVGASLFVGVNSPQLSDKHQISFGFFELAKGRAFPIFLFMTYFSFLALWSSVFVIIASFWRS
jgi:hypothetical protein